MPTSFDAVLVSMGDCGRSGSSIPYLFARFASDFPRGGKELSVDGLAMLGVECDDICFEWLPFRLLASSNVVRDEKIEVFSDEKQFCDY